MCEKYVLKGVVNFDESMLESGMVIGCFGKYVDVEDVNGVVFCCYICCMVDFVVCGDKVFFSKGDDVELGVSGVIEIVKDRYFVLICLDYYDGIKFIVVNIDCIIVVSVILFIFLLNIIDCYFVVCEDIGIMLLIVFNKVELFSEEECIIVIE